MDKDGSETSKCRSVSICKGKLVEDYLYIDGEVIPSIVEKPGKELKMVSDRGQVLRLSIPLVRPCCLVHLNYSVFSLDFCYAQGGL